jgi:hypothetical protein
MGAREIRSALVASPEKFRVTFNSAIPGLEDFLLQGKLESGEGDVNKKAVVNARVAGEQVSLEGEVLIPSKQLSAQGAIRLISSWEQIPNASLEAKLEENGDLDVTGKWGIHNLKVQGVLKPRKGRSLKNSVEADLSLSMDGHEFLQIQSNHLFDQPEYSWNVTFPHTYTFESYLQLKEAMSVLTTRVQWDKNQEVQFRGEAGSGRFSVSQTHSHIRQLKLFALKGYL